MKNWMRPTALAAVMVAALAGLGFATADTGAWPRCRRQRAHGEAGQGRRRLAA